MCQSAAISSRLSQPTPARRTHTHIIFYLVNVQRSAWVMKSHPIRSPFSRFIFDEKLNRVKAIFLLEQNQSFTNKSLRLHMSFFGRFWILRMDASVCVKYDVRVALIYSYSSISIFQMVFSDNVEDTKARMANTNDCEMQKRTSDSLPAWLVPIAHSVVCQFLAQCTLSGVCRVCTGCTHRTKQQQQQ